MDESLPLATAAARRPSLLALLFGWCFVLFGALLFCGAPLGALSHIVLVAWGIPRPARMSTSLLAIIGGTSLHMSAGFICFWAGRQILARRPIWKWSLAIVVAYFCGVAGAMLLWPGGV